jgi:UDP-N-acetylglucosamine 4,6-dehydratase
LGTLNVLEAATACGVKRVIVVSSDKAVAPENAYGKSKAMAEEIAVAYNSISYPKGTRVAVCRWGNVLWSTGSVLCKWREQQAAGLPLTLTDKRMTRFVLTVKQAVAFALHALGAMVGGEIFLPRLPSCRILDLAMALSTEVDVQYAGRRPGGEKLSESLLGPEEMTRTVEQAGAFVVLPSRRGWSTIPYHGTPVKPEWVYASDVNTWWLTVDELRTMIKDRP